MTPHEGLAHFSQLAPSSIKMGLERVVAALARLGNPQTQFPAVHVAGTNGKGSTCAIAASCLRQKYRTGLYTSPHLVRPNERIQIDGVEISDAVFGQRIAEVVEILGADHGLTYFELGTIVAFWHFAQERVDVAVIEVGLGGRLDATTACVPKVTAITPFAFDHMEYLGTTLAQIAGEKAGIIKPGVPLIVAAQEADALESIRSRRAEFWLEGRDFACDGKTWRGPGRVIDGLRLALEGPHQKQNLAVALACLVALTDFPLSDEQLRAGVSAARWPGRLERFTGRPDVLIDGAHNPAGVKVLLDALATETAPITLVFGVFADKDSEPMMRALFPRVARVILTPLANPRSRDPKTYVDFAATLNAQVTVAQSPAHALDLARQQTTPQGLIVVAGSLQLIGQVRPLLTGEISR